MSECFLRARDISKSFGGVHALKSVNLEVNKGEIVCLAGENGSGKSTLIKIISGYYEPDKGTISINGVEHHKLTTRESIHAGIQVIYQDLSVFPNMTVAENIALSYLVSKNKKHVSKQLLKEIAMIALEQLNISLPLDKLVEELNVADKQIVAIARSLVENAQMIIMDEPTSALTHKEVQDLFRVVKHLKQKGIAILFVSHKLEEIFEICDKITVLYNGENTISGLIDEFDKKNLVSYMTGREYSDARFSVEVPKNNPAMRVENLSLDGFFSDVSFELYPGEVLGITGLLGSGRNELALALYGKKKITSGEIYIFGKKVKMKSVGDALDNRISYVPEDRITEGLFIDQSIQRNIIISSIDSYCKFNFVNQDLISSTADEWVSSLNIKTKNLLNPVSTLSGGNQQKVVLAKALSTQPKILILNGPTIGVDVGSKLDISKLIQSIAQNGVSIILISDDSSEILTNCKRILVMKNGSISNEYHSDELDEMSLYQALVT